MKSTKLSHFNQRFLHRFLLLSIILIAVWLRWWQLNRIPLGLWFDEAYNAMDSLWMLDSGSLPMFLEGNNGREPLYHYLTALAMGVLGTKTYTLRIVSAMIGIIAIPLFYQVSKTIFSRHPDVSWLALFSTVGLAFSYWHVTVSRTAFRTILVPPFVIVTLYFFWLGFQRRSFKYFALAGVALGIGQYTYLSFRLFPLVLALFVVIWTLWGRDNISSEGNKSSARGNVWWGLLLTAAISLLFVLPMAVYFISNADKFLERSTQVAFWSQIALGEITLSGHLREAVSVFGTGSDPNWRHDLPTHTAFVWPMMIGFWVGTAVALQRFRQPQYLILIIGLLVMWLPGVLSTPAAHALRLSGMLPFYYLLAGLGVVEIIKLIRSKMPYQQALVPTLNLVVLGGIIVWNGGSTAYDYFWRWANRPEVYEEYKGYLQELTDYLIEQSKDTDLLIPFRAYNYPPTRFLLYDIFLETSSTVTPASPRPTLIVNPSIGRSNWGNSPSYVWLTRDEAGRGTAYISLQDLDPVLPDILTTASSSFRSPTRDIQLASLTPLENIETTRALFFSQPPFIPVNYNWLQKFQLIGYQLVPELVQPGQTLDINLFWRAMERVPDWDYTVLVEIYSGQGRFVSRSEFSTEKLLNWRAEGVEVGARRLFFIGPELPSGPYVLRLKIQWGETIVPATTSTGAEVSDAVLGIFYVTDENGDPRLPPAKLNVNIGDQFELVGFAPPAPLGDNIFRGKLYWRALQPVSDNFTPFVHVVDTQNQIVSQWETVPLAGQYPTSLWSPGETVVDEFDVVLPGELPEGEYRLVAGMLNPQTGDRLSAFDENSTPMPDNSVILSTFAVP